MTDDSTPETEERDLHLQDLPKELGVLLMAVGALGVVLPGVVGAPAFVAGGMVLWPRSFRGVDSWLKRKAPSVHKQSMRQIGRFLDDLESRYPTHATRP